MLLDTKPPSSVYLSDEGHLIKDAVSDGRYPEAFLRKYKPERFEWRDKPEGFESRDATDTAVVEYKEYLTRLGEAMIADRECCGKIMERLERCKNLAIMRTDWNFKTAIPQYYPKWDTMSLLLPLALLRDEEVDCALVVSRYEDTGAYEGRTVLSLKHAYVNARLVCRPDSDWLTPKKIVEEVEESEEQEARIDGLLVPPTDGDAGRSRMRHASTPARRVPPALTAVEHTGTVERINAEKHVGQIADDDPEYKDWWFFHAGSVENPTFAELKKGDRVRYAVGPNSNPKRKSDWMAIKIKRVDSPTEPTKCPQDTKESLLLGGSPGS